MLIKNLRPDAKLRALQLQKEAGNPENEEIDVDASVESGGFNWFVKGTNEGSAWDDIYYRNDYTLYDKLYPQVWQPVFGEVVEVKNDSGFTWSERIFIADAKDVAFSIICVTLESESDFKTREASFQVTRWEFMRQKPKKQSHFTLSEAARIIADSRGLKIEQVIIDSENKEG